MGERSWDELVDLNKRQEYGKAWLPDRDEDAPKTLVGTVCGYDQGPTSEYTGQPQWICTIEDRSGVLWAIWLNRTVLFNEFERQQPKPDERIVVRYRGTQETASKGNSPAHLYSVTVDRPEQALPGFLTKPALGPGERRRDLTVDPNASDVPGDGSEFAYGQQRETATVTDAEVVEDDKGKGKSDDDEIPF